MSPDPRQKDLLAEREAQISREHDERNRLIAAAVVRLRADGCFTRIQVRNAEDLLRGVLKLPPDGKGAKEVLAAQAGMSLSRLHTVLAFAERLNLITVDRPDGPRQINRYLVNFETLRRLDAGGDPKAEYRYSETEQRCVNSEHRSPALDLNNDVQESNIVIQPRPEQRCSGFENSARHTSKHEHEHVKHEHVIPNQTACSMLADKGLEESSLATALQTLIDKRRAAAGIDLTSPLPKRTPNVAPPESRAEPSSDGSGVTTQRPPSPDLATHLAGLIDERDAHPLMFRDVADWVRRGVLSRDAVVGIATSLRETRGRTKPIGSRGAAFRAEVRKILPPAIAESLPPDSPWRERPDFKASGYG